MSAPDKSAGIDKAAKVYRESVERSGGSITQSEARERVAKAAEQGDRKRSDSNR
jgi:hypothetical protein